MLDSEQHLASAITEYKAFVRQAGDKDEMRLKQVESRIIFAGANAGQGRSHRRQ